MVTDEGTEGGVQKKGKKCSDTAPPTLCTPPHRIQGVQEFQCFTKTLSRQYFAANGRSEIGQL